MTHAEPGGAGVVGRLDAYQRRHAWLGVPIATAYKFFEDAGMHVVASMTYYAFAAGIPLLLLSGNLLAMGDRWIPGLLDLVSSTPLADLPFVGERLRGPGRAGLHGGPLGWVVGLLGALYGGVGVAVAFQHGMNTVWQVPRNSRPNPVMARVRGAALFVILVVSVVLSTALGWVGQHYLSRLGPIGHPIGFVASTLINGTVFLVAMQLAVAQRRPWRWFVPGSLVAAAAWQGCQMAVIAYLSRLGPGAANPRVVMSAVLGVLGALWTTIFAIVMASELNVVLHNRLYPRALLTAFTDRVDLTPADVACYTAHARMQRFKGQEEIEVRFGEKPEKTGRGLRRAGRTSTSGQRESG